MEYKRSLNCNNINKIFFVITKNCNLTCPFCIREGGTKENSFLTYDEVSKYMEQLKVITPNATIVITGGEVTTHIDFGKIINKAVELFNKVAICSNGTILKPFLDNIETIKKCTVQISIDGSQFFHDKLRGEGNYSRSKNTIKYLLENKVKTIVASTVSKENISSIKDMFDDMCSIGVDNFKLSQEMPSGFAKQRIENQLDCNEWNLFCDKFNKYTLKLKKNISLKKSFPYVGKRLNMHNVSENMLCLAGCKAGITQLYIYPNKKVYGCPMLLEYPIFDIKNNNLLDIEKKYIKSPLYDYKLSEESKCLNCKYLLICRSGCPGRSKDSNIWAGDFTCPILNK